MFRIIFCYQYLVLEASRFLYYYYTYNFYENMSNFYFDPPTLFWKKKSLTTNKKYTGWPKLMKNKIQDGFRQLHVCRNEYA